MSVIQQEGNYFDISHSLVEWRNDKFEYHYPLRKLTCADLKLYLTLCHFANRFHKNPFWMDDKRLCAYVGVSDRQLGRSRAKLKKMGLIRTKKRTGLALDYEIVKLGQEWRKEASGMAFWYDKDGVPI